MESQHYHKYIIFLAPRFFNKSTIFKSIYERIRKKLENKGIYTVNVSRAIEEIYNRKLIKDIKQSAPLKKQDSILMLNSYCNSNNSEYNSVQENKLCELSALQFDEMDYPSENILYVHLFNGMYYNDKIYPNKKITLEREMLFLLAGNLGVRKITYDITTKENIISRNKASIKLKGVKNQIAYTKKTGNTTITKGQEIYSNNGAPLYCSCSTIDELNYELERTIHTSIFSYDFYKTNPKLETFVYKRLLNKINLLMYTSEAEDLLDISFMVHSCFADFGMQVAFEQTITTTECITYTLEFYDDRELQNVYFTMNYMDGTKDSFYMIKQYYDSDTSDCKETGLNHIKKYIYELAGKYHYKSKGAFRARESLLVRLNDYIRKRGERIFKNKCREFGCTMDIKTWMYNNLIDSKIEEIAETDFLSDNIADVDSDRLSHNTITSDIINEMEDTYRVRIMRLETELEHNHQVILLLTSQLQSLEQFYKDKDKDKQVDKNETDMVKQAHYAVNKTDVQTLTLSKDMNEDMSEDMFNFMDDILNEGMNICVGVNENNNADANADANADMEKILELPKVRIDELSNISPRRTNSRIESSTFTSTSTSRYMKKSKDIENESGNINTKNNEIDEESLIVLKNKYIELENRGNIIKNQITHNKMKYENERKMIDQSIESLLLELSLTKSKLRSLNERQVLEQIKAIGKDKTRNQDKYYNNCNGTTNRNSFSTSNNNKNDTSNGTGTGTGGIINESKNALRKLFTSDNDILERQISRENNNVNEIEKRINELKEQKEMSYQEIKSLTFEYDALIEEKNKIILECHNWAIDIENYKSIVEIVDSSKILIANETMV